MKLIFAPHLGHNVQVGGRRHSNSSAQGRVLRFSKYSTNLPSPPTTIDYSAKAVKALQQMYLNDTLGDCVIAQRYHIQGVTTGNAKGAPFIATAAQITKDYSSIGGYIPGNANSDQGCDLITALNYWVKTGLADGTKDLGYLAIDPTNVTEIKQAVWLFENLAFGVDLPDTWITPFPSKNGFVWDVGTPDVNNGHSYNGYGYAAAGVEIDSWGLLGLMTWAAIARLCSKSASGELYVILTPTLIASAQAKSPSGFDFNTLIADFDAMGGNVPVPSPTPVPVPVPVAVTLTLAQVQALLAANWPKA